MIKNRIKAKEVEFGFLVAVFVILLMFEVAVANGPAVQWEKTFGGTGSDSGYSVQQTSDDGYIITGSTSSFSAGDPNAYLIKTDCAGNTQWEKTFGGTGSDSGSSVQQTSDGGYIITGSTSSFGAGDPNVYLVKTDSDGNMQWQKTFGGSESSRGQSVQQTSDGGYIIAGYSFRGMMRHNDVYLIKTDPNGNSQWQKIFGGNDRDEGHSVQQTSDGGYMIAGFTRSNVWQAYLIKTDPNGNSQWENIYGGSSVDEGYSGQQTSDGGYIIAGYSDSFPVLYDDDVYLVKTDPDGNMQWQNTFGGSTYDWGYSVQQTSDGGYVIVGDTYSFGAGSWDIYVIKTDSEGNSQWEKTFGGTGSDGGSSVQQTSDGGYIIAGSTRSFGAGSSDVYLIKLVGDPFKPEDVDFNGDWLINSKDFSMLAQYWLQNEGSVDIAPKPFGDCVVDLKDIKLFVEYWPRDLRLAFNPVPPYGADLVDPNIVLSWSPGVNVDFHLIYFGDNFEDVNNADPYSPEFIKGQPETSWDPCDIAPLPFDETYFWRIDEYESESATMYKGETWNFTTGGLPPL
jgi:hypothetical protein